MDYKHNDFLWATVTLKDNFFAISANDIQTMVILPEVVSVPKVPKYVRGMINVRGQVLPLIDLRLRLGMKSYVEEFVEMLEHRENDHRKWVAELEACVKEKREFKLTTDPHKCAFGKWYDTFRTNNLLITMLLKEFDEPHKRLHGKGEVVKDLVKSGDAGGAQKIVDECKEREFKTMIGLFDALKDMYRKENREIAVVLDGKPRNFAIAVDAVASIGMLAEGSFEEISKISISSFEKGLITGVGRDPKENKQVLTLATDRIMEINLDVRSAR